MTDSERLQNLLNSNPKFAKIWESQIKKEEEDEAKKNSTWEKIGLAILCAHQKLSLESIDPELFKIQPVVLTAAFLITFYPNKTLKDENELLKLYNDIAYFNSTVPFGYEECLEFRGTEYLMLNLKDDKGIYTKIIPYPEIFVASL